VSCDWLLIDGPSLIFRAFYGARARAASPQALRTGAIHGLLERLAWLLTERRPRRLVVADDWSWRPEWRVDLIPEYKSHRAAEPVPPGLAPQLPVIRSLLEVIGIDAIGVADYEAEDVIATLAKLADGMIEIYSGDRDTFALVEDERVRILYPEKTGLAVIGEQEVTRRYGIPGRRYGDFAILRGDPSDGLPGLRGVGAVSAAAMIRRHGDIAGVLRERTLRDADREYLERAAHVVPPVDDLSIALPPGRRDTYPADASETHALASRYGVQDACARLVSTLVALPRG
jgi:5'-3' exonuclease